ncbi:thiol peroxidase [Enterovibrio nigricans]|uniref:Thiol peroxidase n=1 Tax=Enterovibrio nigricans DSM 22720 TaxID=1121868 RepID=A0A1T4UF60_9GAMM|nr:thiol peroxidase [Enterovibrio nigricans]PKF49305.1 thiol peroxidase [Enterovibrio nigricans]SKA51324.1 thiol peroxidase, atypical 2-Cys peroxiredoxin [Enterovibrio nigricans DSM 22720]
MPETFFQGQAIPLSGNLPQVGSPAPNFTLTAADLSDLTLESLRGNKIILNIFPSIDTPTCASSVRAFNEKAAAVNNTKVVCISADLPFAVSRFCELEGLMNVQHASTLRSPDFMTDYGVAIAAGPMVGLSARAVIVVNEGGVVKHVELVRELSDEPNYDAALEALKR